MSLRFFLSCLFLILMAGNVMAREVGEPDPGWKFCKADKDCVEITIPCGSTAVNKKFEFEAQDFYLNSAYKQLDCKNQKTDPHRRIICQMTEPCDDSPTGLCPSTKGACSVLHPDQQ